MIDVITIVKNGEETIERMLHSMDQQEIALHHIIIDGHSTDKTVSIIEKSSTKQRRQVYSQVSKGISNAFNEALAKATSEYVFFLNADDWLVPKALDQLIQWADKYPNFDFYCGRVKIFSKEGDLIVESASDHNNIRTESSIHHAATLMRRSVIDQIGSFDNTYHLAMDYELFLRASHQNCRFQNVPITVAHRQLGGISYKYFIQALTETRKARATYESKTTLWFWYFFAIAKDMAGRITKSIAPKVYQNYWRRVNRKITKRMIQ